jgi:hypothetical protein
MSSSDNSTINFLATNSSISNASSTSSATVTDSVPNQFSNGITFSRGPFDKKYYSPGKLSKDPKPASTKPSICIPRSHDRFWFSNPDDNDKWSKKTWSGARFNFKGTYVLEVFITPVNGNEASAGYKHESSWGFCRCCCTGPENFDTFNLRVTPSSYLVSEYDPGISIVTDAIIEESRYFSEYFGKYFTTYNFEKHFTKFNLLKSFYILRLETGDIAIQNSEGEWCEYIMKEEEDFSGINIAFQGCGVIVEAMNIHSKSVEDIITEGTSHITRIRALEKAESERLAPIEAAKIAAWTVKKAADDKAEAEAKAKSEAKAIADAAYIAKLREARLKLYSIITKYILPVLRVKMAKKKEVEDKKAREDLEKALKEQEEEW